MKFQVGDIISYTSRPIGMREATIIGIDDKFYHCKIMCGSALIPICAEENYQLIKKNSEND